MNTTPDDDLNPMPADLLPPGDGVIVSRGPAGAVLRPSSAARATPAQHELLHDLQRLALDIAEQQQVLRGLVAEARALHLSWGLIGWVLGMSSEGARQKYDLEARRPRSSKTSRRRAAR